MFKATKTMQQNGHIYARLVSFKVHLLAARLSMWCAEWHTNIGNANTTFSRVLYFCINYRGCVSASFLTPLHFTIVCSSVRYLSNVLRKKWLYPESSHPVFLCLLSFDKYLYAAFDTVWGVHTCRTSKLGPLIYLWGWSPWCRERITPVSVRALSVSVLRKSKWHLLFRSQESSNSSYPLIKEDLSSVAFHRTYHR